MYRYTICFLKQNNRLLMLNRNRPPVMGLWNGVGGKLENSETPLASVLREVLEETGIRLETASYKGVIEWHVNGQDPGGMYAFVAELPADLDYPTPRLTDEGILTWKDIDWLLHEQNEGVPENLPHFLPRMLTDSRRYFHTFFYEKDIISSYESTLLLDPAEQCDVKTPLPSA